MCEGEGGGVVGCLGGGVGWCLGVGEWVNHFSGEPLETGGIARVSGRVGWRRPREPPPALGVEPSPSRTPTPTHPLARKGGPHPPLAQAPPNAQAPRGFLDCVMSGCLHKGGEGGKPTPNKGPPSLFGSGSISSGALLSIIPLDTG